MDNSEGTAKIIDSTYKHILEDFGPNTKQLVVAGRTYLKSLHAMMAASRQYTEALAKIASLAANSTLSGSADIGSTLYGIVDVNKEILSQQSNIIKSLEYDFLEPMEIAAEKDTKLVGREQKRFQQLYKGRREAYLKCVTTLKKTRRRKSVNTDKQLSHMKMLESAKERLEVFCSDSLKEAVVQERMMYGTVLERQCALNRQFLIYHTKSSEILEEQLGRWESVAERREQLPDAALNQSQLFCSEVEGSLLERVIRHHSIARSYGRAQDNIYARPITRAKSDFCLATEEPRKKSGKATYARALYAYDPTGEHQMALGDGDLVKYVPEDSTTGWQFGENLTTRDSGWFPMSYTESVPDQDRLLFDDVNSSPPMNGSVRSKLSRTQQVPYGEYATLTRSKKLLPASHYTSQPNIYAAPLPSMRL